MGLPKFENDMSIIRKQPNQVVNQAEKLKEFFDKAGEDIKKYLNDILTVSIDEELLKKDAEISRVYESIEEKIAELVDSSPDALNTLKELADALGNDPDFANTVLNLIASKVDKEEGKGLSENDFTTILKEKLDGITDDNLIKVVEPIFLEDGREDFDRFRTDKATVYSVKGGFYTVNGKLKGYDSNITIYANYDTLVRFKEASVLLYVCDGNGDGDNLWTEYELDIDGVNYQLDTLIKEIKTKASKEDVYTKVDKVEGKGLSSNDFTDEHKNALEIVVSDVEGLQKQIHEEAHFRGYLSTNAKIQALEATPNDYAYSAESGTKWVYDAENGWQDTNIPVPDQLTPASDTTPLINGIASVGTENAYARGDHRHPTDTTRASVEDLNNVRQMIGDIDEALDELHNYAQAIINGGA